MAISLIDFCISALFAGHGSELFILYVKNFSKESTCGHELAGFILGMTAFGAVEIQRDHGTTSPDNGSFYSDTRMKKVYSVTAAEFIKIQDFLESRYRQ
jgi:hypothetical protein